MQYNIAFEIAGPAAMFARPDTGAAPVSYPVPTGSAAKGMFDSILWRPHVNVRPTRVELCKPVQYQKYVTNYKGPLRLNTQLKGNYAHQTHAIILADVCYKIYGTVSVKRWSSRGKIERCNGQRELRRRRGVKDWAKIYQEEFNRRLELGQSYYMPCLGWKCFVPSYVGKLRESTGPVNCDSIYIPAMLISLWEHHEYKPVFEERTIKNGVMAYWNDWRCN